ncbi:Tryptophan--tRNA ligase, mitochondrial [Trapelia coarctata]|nr:Tryptophan--tRNA ligase, mitochondrial [Trapelia coarctata]
MESEHESALSGTTEDSLERLESDQESSSDIEPRLPRSVQAVYLRPLKRQAKYGVPACDLQLRSYSVRNVEFFADFALRAAYYLNLPAAGPIPLPRITERWTVPRSNFIHKKSQENFERITLRRLIQIQDGHPDTVEIWLAFLRKHAYYGVGMKANVWEYEKLGVGKTMDISLENLRKVLEPKWAHFGRKKNPDTAEKVMEMLNSDRFKNVDDATSSQVHRQPGSGVTPAPPTAAKIIFSGIQPTGVPHLGNYLGALRQWVQLQDTAAPDTKLLFSIVDLHALTIRQGRGQLQRWKRETLATLLAVGLDPKRSIIFFQSDIPAHTELMWILSCTASMGHLSRMTQWKSKLALEDDASPLDTSSKAKLKLGLFSYPVLQAADVLVHGATHVPVGDDQAQHLEFARECAGNFNSIYGKVLTEPATILCLAPAKRVMSLKEPHLKMSKSHQDPRSRISLSDTADEIHLKVKQALTDSISGVSYDPKSRPGVSNLLEILSHLDGAGRSPVELAQEHSPLSMRSFKEHVAQRIADGLAGFRERYTPLIDAGRLEDVAMQGAKEARYNAGPTMLKVRDSLGI